MFEFKGFANAKNFHRPNGFQESFAIERKRVGRRGGKRCALRFRLADLRLDFLNLLVHFKLTAGISGLNPFTFKMGKLLIQQRSIGGRANSSAKGAVRSRSIWPRFPACVKIVSGG